jgi:hypothetical protein
MAQQQQNQQQKESPRNPSLDAHGDGGVPAFYAHTEEEITPKVVRITPKVIILAIGGVFVAVCAAGWYILNVKAKLERRFWMELISGSAESILAATVMYDHVMAHRAGVLRAAPTQDLPPTITRNDA